MTSASFDEEILRNAKRVRNFVRSQVRSAADADDLCQETLLKAFRSRDSLRDEARLQTCLFRIARRTVIDYYRRHSPDERLRDAAESTPSQVDAITAAVARAALCYLGTLPDEYRIAVHMADYQGLPHAEIACRLGISLSSAKSRIRRGKQRIRELMEECCLMVYDTRGKVVDYERRQPCSRSSCG